MTQQPPSTYEFLQRLLFPLLFLGKNSFFFGSRTSPGKQLAKRNPLFHLHQNGRSFPPPLGTILNKFPPSFPFISRHEAQPPPKAPMKYAGASLSLFLPSEMDSPPFSFEEEASHGVRQGYFFLFSFFQEMVGLPFFPFSSRVANRLPLLITPNINTVSSFPSCVNISFPSILDSQPFLLH